MILEKIKEKFNSSRIKILLIFFKNYLKSPEVRPAIELRSK